MSKDSVVVLYIGGRLPSWYALTAEQQEAASSEHVELMLSVAKKHRMMQLEGYKLLTPIGTWQRFWPIEFPDLAGAEAWIEAETMPPYGLYGHYEYYLARRWGKKYFDAWVTNPPTPAASSAGDPTFTPNLEEDKSSTVVLLFGRSQPGAEAVSPAASWTWKLARTVFSRRHGLLLYQGRASGQAPHRHAPRAFRLLTQVGPSTGSEPALSMPK